MSPNPDSVSTKHRGSRAKAPRREVPGRPKEPLASAAQPNGKLVSAEFHPHPNLNELPAREERIRVAAYLLSEQRGFTPGEELQDWLAAEAEIDRLMAVEIAVGFRG